MAYGLSEAVPILVSSYDDPPPPGYTIIVRLNRRTYSPVLRSADIPDTTVPWWGGRHLHFEYT